MKMNIYTEKVIPVDEWNLVIQETYGRIYNFQQQDDCKVRQRVYITIPAVPEDYENITVPEIVNGPEMGVSFDAWLQRDPKLKGNLDSKSSLGLWWQRNFYPHVSMVANDLHAKGIIEAGEYAIDIDW